MYISVPGRLHLPGPVIHSRVWGIIEAVSKIEATCKADCCVDGLFLAELCLFCVSSELSTTQRNIED